MLYKSIYYKLPALVLVVLLLVSCAGFTGDDSERDVIHDLNRVQKEYLRIDDSIEPDEEMKAFIKDYASDLFAYMGRKLTVSTGVIERGQPESPLGNLTADILRNRATREMGTQVDVAILNRGGLRIPIPEGEVTVGTVYELMPFENHITMLRFNGRQMRQLANELAIEGGEPVSGLRMRIDNGRATDLLVNGQPVSDQKEYWVATNNWLADGGGPLPTLWSPLERRDLEVMIRDAFIEYLVHVPEISPFTDYRIRD